MSLLITVALLDVFLAFLTSVFTKSAALRFFTWFAIWLGVAMTFALYLGEGFFSFISFTLVGVVSAGVGSITGYLAQRFKRPFWLFHPLVPERPAYHGLRCVACNRPIERENTLCPNCGWTQPPSEKPT